jgi:hypothetical protein
MRKRKLAGKVTVELSLPVLLDRLELALVGIPNRTSVCKALSDLNKHLSSVGEKGPPRTRRSRPPRRRRQTAVESLPVFS